MENTTPAPVDSTDRVLSDVDKRHIQTVKEFGASFQGFVTSLGSSREISTAKTKIEEAVMWAVKHITG